MKSTVTTLPVLSACALLCLPAGFVNCAWAVDQPQGSGDAALAALADDYFDHYYFPANPTAATTVGIHRYDGQLEDYSRAGVEREIHALRAWQRRFEAAPVAALSEHSQGDRELLISSIRSSLLTLETIKPWQKDPDSYSSGITEGAYAIMERNFAPPEERLRHLIEREQLMPAALQAAHANLRNPPEVYTRIAIEQLPDDISFFQTDVPAAFSGVGEPALRAHFNSVNGRTIAALRDYQRWLQRQVLPRSHGDFRIGAKTFRAKLLYDEMVDTPLDQLLEIGMADLRRNQEQFGRVAYELEPDKSAAQVLAELAADHPDPHALLAAFRADLDGLVTFITQHHIITIPSDVRPAVRETPPFMRATTFASMDTPGPYETVAHEAYFNVTLPDPSWDKQHTEGFMADDNFPLISNIAVHEAYPGHYVQFLWMQRIDDRVRRLVGANSNSEGWAHYCEQMMLDEGYGQPGADAGAADQRQAHWLRLAQLQDALLRDARFVVGIRMHTGQMSMAQAIDFFVSEGYQSREVGEVETKRGSSDPTYLYYTLGKLQIMKLRADLQAREGAAFNLQRFHDDFMQQGFPPVKLVRRAMMHDDSPTL
jgi:uncharacterized protein (DUF885 family)